MRSPCALNLFQSCRNAIEEVGTGGSCGSYVVTNELLTGVSSCKTTGSLTALGSLLTVVELSLSLAGNCSTAFDTALTILEVSLAVIDEFLTVVDLLVVVAAAASTVPVKSLGTLDVSSFEVVLTVAGESLSIAGKAPEPISSINTVFNGFCVP